MEDKFSLVNKTRGKMPLLPFVAIKNDILGKDYFLSFAYITSKQIQEINTAHRGKNKPTNVLSFSLTKNSGEILICPSVVRAETKKFQKTFSDLLGFLVIHGMLHLKGHEHSSRMEALEHKYDQKYFYRNRRGVYHDESSSRRVLKRGKKS